MDTTTVAAVYTFAAHYHSGQWSRGYRLLCAADKAWRRKAGIGPRLDYWEAAIKRYQTAMIATTRGNFADYASGNHEMARKYTALVATHGKAI